MDTSHQWHVLLQSQNLHELLDILLSSRIPVTPHALPYLILLYTPSVYLAYLARREGTYILRLFILPIVLTCTLFSGWGFVWTAEDMLLSNWGQSLILAKSLEYTFTREGMLKIDEVRPGIHAAHPKPNGAVNRNSNDKQHSPPLNASKWNQGLIDAFELLHALRGLDFHFGVGVPIPAHTRPLDRPAFLLDTFFSLLCHSLALDVFDSGLKLFPGVGSSSGGSIFYGSLNLPLRLVVATTIHIMTGCSLIAGFKTVYDLVTLFAVGICHSSPENWPPVMDDPWSADSLHRFWARDWHQLLRRTFFVYGGYPARQLVRFFSRLFARVNKKVSSAAQTAEHFAVVFGTFVASGLWHECTMYAMGRGFSLIPIYFFASQTGLLVGERAWRKVTGKKVGGIWGRMWVYFVIFIMAQPMVDSWHRRGVAGGVVVPPPLSPVRALVLPLMKKGLATVTEVVPLAKRSLDAWG